MKAIDYFLKLPNSHRAFVLIIAAKQDILYCSCHSMAGAIMCISWYQTPYSEFFNNLHKSYRDQSLETICDNSLPTIPCDIKYIK